MRILIGSLEVCGLIYNLGEEYKKNGHSVVTIAGKGNKYFDYKYDIDPERVIYSFFLLKTRSAFFSKLADNVISFFGKNFINFFNSLIIKCLLSNTDCYIQIYDPVVWEEERFLKHLKQKNKKVITLFVGSDIRDYNLFKEKYDIKRWSFSEDLNKPGSEIKRNKLRVHEKYSNAIFSVPDQSLSATKPYFHFQLPLQIEKFQYVIPERDIPIVVHAPSKPEVKGTDLIIETLDRLKKEGIAFELILVKDMPHDQIPALLSNADVLVDEIVLHGPGFLSFEAMLSGCAVATRYLESSPDCFRPPIWNIDENNIYSKLKELLLDKDLRINLAKKGRKYALENNDIRIVSEQILDKLNSKSFDYFPLQCIMSKQRILILSYSNLSSDPRVARQIFALKEKFQIDTLGLSKPEEESVEFYQIFTQPKFSIIRKVKRLLYFVLRLYDFYYWDGGKIDLVKRFKKNGYSVIIANDIFTLPLALSIANGISKVYFDAHEYHPQEFNDSFKWRLIHKPYVEFLCTKYIEKADDFSTVSYGIAEKYNNYLGIFPKIVTNAAAFNDLNPMPVNGEKIRLIHHGAAIKSRKLELMIELGKYLEDRFDFDIILVGFDKEYIEELKKMAEPYTNIKILEPVKQSQICSFTNQYDLGIFLLPPTNVNYLFALPNKIFEFIQARLGVVISPNPEMARIVKDYDLGVVSNDYNPESMAKVINSLTIGEIENYKKNSHMAALELSAETEYKKIDLIVSGLALNNVNMIS